MRQLLGEDNPVFREQFLGEWVFYGGRVYPQFQTDSHVIEPFEIPNSWPRIRVIDFGLRDPFVCLWAAVGPTGELYIYREYYKRNGLTREHAQYIKDKTGDEKIRYTIADRSSSQLIADLGYEGIRGIIPSDSDHESGRAAVGNFLLPTTAGEPPFSQAENKKVDEKYPKLYLFDTCPETIREFKFYRWAEASDIHRQGAKEKTEGEDHSMDCIRYLCKSRPSPFKTRPRIVPGTMAAAMAGIKDKNRRGRLIGR